MIGEKETYDVVFTLSKLRNDGKVCCHNTKEGSNARNAMHWLVMNAFVPVKGQPNMIDMCNYYCDFLMPEGEPSTTLIIEGVSPFVTTCAIKALFDEARIIIVLDSSTNWATVIVSSMCAWCHLCLMFQCNKICQHPA